MTNTHTHTDTHQTHSHTALLTIANNMQFLISASVHRNLIQLVKKFVIDRGNTIIEIGGEYSGGEERREGVRLLLEEGRCVCLCVCGVCCTHSSIRRRSLRSRIYVYFL